MGSPMYPAGTNHFNPYSPLFKKEQRTYLGKNTICVYIECCPVLGFTIFMSNLGITSMACVLYYLGKEFFFWYYLIPYIVSFLMSVHVTWS
jgi:omega-6 fatty acid desaturase (delta-12 desaturase)